MKHFSELLVIFGLVLVCMALGQALVLVSLAIFYGVNADANTLKKLIDIPKLLQYEAGVWILYYMQAVVSLCSLVLSAWLFRSFLAPKEMPPLNRHKTTWLYIGVAMLFALVALPAISEMVWWNYNLKLPAFLQKFERGMRLQESGMSVLMSALTNFETVWHFLVAVVVIAVIPAVGEELWFRGVLQNKLQDFMSPHAAIWITGFIFSAVHFQFYGFFPRWLLGVAFGYVYWWSGNLWLSIAAHFVNNFVTLLAIYLFRLKVISSNMHDPSPVAWYWVLPSVALSAAMLYYLYQKRHIAVPEKENLLA